MGGLRVLLLDDDLDYAKLFKTMVSDSLPAMSIDHVINGAEAMKLLTNGYRPSVIISDIRMPVMNGHEFLEKVRGLPDCEDLNFIMMSSTLCDENDKEAGLCKATKCLEKPCSMVEWDDFVSDLRNMVRLE